VLCSARKRSHVEILSETESNGRQKRTKTDVVSSDPRSSSMLISGTATKFEVSPAKDGERDIVDVLLEQWTLPAASWGLLIVYFSFRQPQHNL
jgi:hypothetical protein